MAYICRDEEISALCLELSMLLHAGVDCAGGLNMASMETKEPKLKALLKAMSQKMDGGAPLFKVIAESGAFPHNVSAMLEVGERTGRSEQALAALAKYYDRRAQRNSRLRSALMYPSVLLVIMLAVIVVLLTQVLPVFQQVYEGLGGSMTGVAGSLLSLGRWINTASPVLLGIIGASAFIFILFAFIRPLKNAALRALKKIRGHRGNWGLSAKARFASGLSMCLASGLHPEEALLEAGKLMDNPILSQKAAEAVALFKNGESLPHALQKTELLPPSQCRLLELGFAGGSGERAMEEVASRLDLAAEEDLERKVSRVEPTMVVACSLLVGAVLLSVMLPLARIMANIG